MMNPTNQWMDPQQWMGQFTDTTSNTVEMVTKGMKMWNAQVNQVLDITKKNVNAVMENMQMASEQVYHAWESSITQMTDAYKAPKKTKETTKPSK